MGFRFEAGTFSGIKILLFETEEEYVDDAESGEEKIGKSAEDGAEEEDDDVAELWGTMTPR